MALTLTCPFCNSETPTEHNFCIICNQQTKCLSPSCGKKLVPGKPFCFSCGQAIAKLPSPSAQVNKYVRDIKQSGKTYEEYTEFSMSDHAVSEIAPFIVGQIISRPQKGTHKIVPNAAVVPQQLSLGLEDALPEMTALQLPEAPSAQTVETNLVGAASYFEQDGGYLVANIKDFKGTTWAEQQKRFILLYAAAYNQICGQTVPDKEHFRKAAERASVLDPRNFPKYLGEITRTYLNEIGGGFKLNHDGEKEVRAILAQIEDGNIGSGNKYWERNGTTSGKRQRFNKEDKIKIQEWALEEVDIGSLNIRDIHRAKDYALVSLWLLTVHLNKVQAVRSNDAYYYFKEKFKTISVKAETFKEALFKPSNSRYFRKTEDSFFLTSKGQQIVEAWTTGAPIGATDISEDEVVN
ncbi:zinc ribbon domain-containing protein [Trichocoleus sp. FACHB-591]|nr:zinc ribbon domain-containing protein [Trichocoleus sp. FACHB-591]